MPAPSVGERLATLESLAQENRRRITELHDSIHGGPSCEWEQSIRGRLHAMAENLATADKLAEAAREVRRMQSETHRSRIKTWQWSVLAACSVAVAAAPYVALFFAH